MTENLTLPVPGATIVYDVHGPLPAADGRPPLLMIGQPMDASGFSAQLPHFTDRTVVTYDPRGLGRSTRHDGRTDNDPVVQAEDLHALVTELGGGPVEVFASSGGAVSALAWVTAHPDDVSTLVAHEPPLLSLLPDAEAAYAGQSAYQRTYRERGFNVAMAHFIVLTSLEGEIPADWADQPPPDPTQFGMPADDDGTRDDPLLSDASNAITGYRPDLATLTQSPTRIVVAGGVETTRVLTGRTAAALAASLDLPLTEFPSHHGGFMGGEFGYAGEPEAFAARLREVLAGS